MPLKLSITDREGEVFDILTQDSKGHWYDSDGEKVASGVHQLLRFGLADILDDANAWALKRERAK